MVAVSIDFRPDAPDLSWDSDLILNVANGNAVKILQVLGLYDPEADCIEGSISPRDLKDRVLLARLADDTGEPDAVENRGGGPTVVYCGLRPGYYEDRLNALDEIADYCIRYDLKVVWY